MMFLVLFVGWLVGVGCDILTEIAHPAFYWSVGWLTGAFSVLSFVILQLRREARQEIKKLSPLSRLPDSSTSA